MATVPNSQSDAAATRLYSSAPEPRIRLCLLFHAPSINHQAITKATDSPMYETSCPSTTRLGSKPNLTIYAPDIAQTITNASTTRSLRDVRCRQSRTVPKSASPKVRLSGNKSRRYDTAPRGRTPDCFTTQTTGLPACRSRDRLGVPAELWMLFREVVLRS
jgi:hypothetical protein